MENDILAKNSAIFLTSKRQPKYRTYPWELDLSIQQFTADKELMEQLFGEASTTISAKYLLRLVPSSQRRMVHRTFKQVLTSEHPKTFHCCLMTPTSLFTFVEFTISQRSETALMGTIAPCLVVPSQMAAADIFYSVFENRHHGVLVADSETRILACNRQFERLTGYEMRDLVGLKTKVFNAEVLSEEYYEALWQKIERHGYWSGTILTRKADGGAIPQDMTIHKIAPGNGQHYYLGFSSDLSDQLSRLDDHQEGGVDLLTQLPSTERFIQSLTTFCNESQPDTPLILLALQPHFPSSNEQEIKRQFASYIAESTRTLIAGYLGESRFVVLLSGDSASSEQSIRVIRKAIKLFFHSFNHAQGSVALAMKTGLTGVSLFHHDAQTPDQLVSHAFQALFGIKKNDSKHVVFYDRKIHGQIERKKQLEVKVTQAILSESIDVHFQPIVDLKHGRIDKFEALCRFPDFGELAASTQELINIVEDLDQIIELDDVVNRKSMASLSELQALFGEHIGLSVNRSFYCKEDVTEVLRHCVDLIGQSGLSPHHLTIEFTESAYFESNRHQEQLLDTIRKAGVTIAVDDFGTGSASLSYLNKRYFDVLKIDQMFVNGLSLGSRQYHIVKTIIHLAQKLGLKVVAEGVETQEELDILSDLGIDYIQGYFFSKPLSLEDLRHVGALSIFTEKEPTNVVTLLSLRTRDLPKLDPGDPLSLIHAYFESESVSVIPVIDSGHCVGLVDRVAMSLHMTVNMGTDHETNQEQANWSKPANRMMTLPLVQIDCQTPVSKVISLLDQKELPWVLTDSDGKFKGIVEQKHIMGFLTEQVP
ncbi:EAL domain-containing protein [Vibrio ostreicida]|uniref:EAL domain-containing protein n=1 Tax=Vibrio ostreicida TaxID=526588 RepID=UPI00097043E2|nr:EAL domain-containing protein [Vibrio ostreicida]